MPSVQDYVKNRLTYELKNKLETDLTIDKLHIQPFNTIELNGVELWDRESKTIMQAEKIYGKISLFSLLKKNITITALRLNNFEINLSQKNTDSPLNIKFIIDAFKPDEEKKTPSAFDFKISSINLQNGNFNWDLYDKPAKNGKLFDENHIRITEMNSRLSLKSLKSDSLNIQISHLNLKEKSGINIKNLTTRIITRNNKIYVRGFELNLPNSLLQFSNLEIDNNELPQNKSFPVAAKINASVKSSYITPKDVAAFSDLLNNFDERLYIDGDISGTADNIDLSSLTLEYNGKMQLEANASVMNLPDKDSLYISGNVNNFQITSSFLSLLANTFSNKNKPLPAEITNLGTISFKGDISGYMKQLKANGLLKADPGTININLLFGFNTPDGMDSFFNGEISTNEFELGNILPNPDFDKLTFDLIVDIKKPHNKKMGGSAKGLIKHFDYRNYPYQNIHLNGEYNNSVITGEFLIDDENIYMDINGLFDFSKKQPAMNFDARVRGLRADRLNLSDKYENSYLSLDVHANITGNTIDNAEGSIIVDSLRFFKDNSQFLLDNFVAESFITDSIRKFNIESEIINGEVTGKYSFLSLIDNLQKTMHPYLPALIPYNGNKKNGNGNDNMQLNFTVGNTEDLSKAFSLPFVIFSEAKIIGYYNNELNKFNLEVYYPSGKIAGTTFKSGYFKAENTTKYINSTFTGLFLGKNNVQNDLSIKIKAWENNVETNIDITNDSQNNFSISLGAITNFSKEDKNSPLYTNIEILPREIVLNDTVWKVEPSRISISPNLIEIDNFNFHNGYGDQSISINGNYSAKAPGTLLKTELDKINLEYVFNTLAIDALNFSGHATGTLYLSNVDGKPYPNVNLEVAGFGFNNTALGYLNLFSELENETNNILLSGKLITEEQKVTNIKGSIDAAKQQLSIYFDSERINIGFLNKYAETLFDNISGHGSGNIHLYGDFSNVTVEGKAFIENGSLGINFLNTSYSFTDSVFLKNDLIYFNNVTLYDQNKNTAKINGKVAHDYFTNFMYYVELNGENFMLYNATEKHNPMFYGKIFGSGTGSISGDERSVNIEGRLRSDKNTNICMNFMEETVDTYSFITYKSHNSSNIHGDTLNGTVPAAAERTIQTDSDIEINMNFYVDATPDATVEIIMDPVGGDKLRGTGNGALQFEWSTKSSPRLYGTYTINRGSYNFTFQKIIERRFNIQNGSNVLFRGDPFQANIDVTAIYKLNANLNDLDQNLVESTGQTTVPVECILNITGELRHPNVGMDVALPAADAEVQRQVKSLMNNEDMINRQMVYLLLLSKFYTPNYATAEHRSNDLAAVASATLSTQLSKVLSMIDDRWQFGTNIRTSDSQFTSTEVELLLSSQLLNDRALINGNFGYRDNPQTQDAFIGDIDVEVLLNSIGTWRLKAYNHYNEKYYIHGTGNQMQTQGLGILYKKDFDNLNELFNIKPRLPNASGTLPQPLLPDSTAKGSSLGAFIRIKEND